MLPLVSTLPLGSSIFTALSVGGIRCGSKICGAYEYCSKFHNDCEGCAPICDEQHHNFDREQCLNDCQSKFIDIF